MDTMRAVPTNSSGIIYVHSMYNHCMATTSAIFASWYHLLNLSINIMHMFVNCRFSFTAAGR